MEDKNGDDAPRLHSSMQHDHDATASTHDAPVPIDAAHSPPFWARHGRSESSVSYQSISHLRPPPISLEDHSEADNDHGRGCWAKHATVDDYVVVSGPTGIGAYVVWNCTIETIKGAPFTIRKRYVSDNLVQGSHGMHIPLLTVFSKAIPSLTTYGTILFGPFPSLERRFQNFHARVWFHVSEPNFWIAGELVSHIS